MLSTVLTDVATGAGTSGGPILDATGHVVALHTAAYGSTPHVDPVSGQVFRSLEDWSVYTEDDEMQSFVADADASTQLGGGLASPMLWRIYTEILANPRGGNSLTKRTIPCAVLPCVPGNATRIRHALGKDAAWVLPATGGYCVTSPTARGLEAGDVVVSVGGTQVAGTGSASLHDVTWLQHGTMSVQVIRGGVPVRLPEIQLVPIPTERDVAVGRLQAGTDDIPRADDIPWTRQGPWHFDVKHSEKNTTELRTVYVSDYPVRWNSSDFCVVTDGFIRITIRLVIQVTFSGWLVGKNGVRRYNLPKNTNLCSYTETDPPLNSDERFAHGIATYIANRRIRDNRKKIVPNMFELVYELLSHPYWN